MRAETSATSAITALSVALAAAGHALAGGSITLTSLPHLLALATLGWTLGEHLTTRWLSLTALPTLQLTTHLTLDWTHPSQSPPALPDHAAMAHTATAAEHAAMGHAATAAEHAAAATAMGHGATAMGHGASGSGLAGAMSGMGHAAGGGVPGAAESAAGAAGGMHDGVAGALVMSAAHLVVLVVGVVLVASTHRWVRRVLRILARLVPALPGRAVAIPVVRAALAAVPDRPQTGQRWLVSGVSRRGPPEYGVLAALS